MEKIISIPEKVAIIFLAGDSSVADAQYESIRLAELPFELVPYFRYNRQTFHYQSYSQMFNDCIDDTEEEFMIFVNPKSIVSSEDVEKIIKLLCSGFCFVGIFGIAFSGFTKELIRNIGMMDEAFIGGEYEDNDILVRIKRYGKAVYWGQDWSKYDFYPSSFPPIRGGFASSHFWRKWRWKDNILVDSQISRNHKMLAKRHSLSRKDISDSWLGFVYSWGENHIWDMVSSCSLINSFATEHLVETDMQINIEFIEGSLKVEFIAPEDTAISVVATTVYSEGRIPFIGGRIVPANTWFVYPISNERIEIRLWHDEAMIYMNTIEMGYQQSMYFRLPCSVLR
jgi:hypothetical protein